MPEASWILFVLVFSVALLYASVGHGGASGYLAILSLAGMPPQPMAASALLLNLVVSAIAFLNFRRVGSFSWGLTWPFVIASVPFAWIGGVLPVSPKAYEWLLAAVLLFAAWRLWGDWAVAPDRDPPAWPIAVPTGAGIGLLSGVVGIGGGIFLSPLLLLKGWSSPRQAAATSSFFILANSAAGLLGRIFAGSPVWGSLPWLAGGAVCGGVIGSRLGARHFSGMTLRRILAGALTFAAIRAAAA